MKIVVDTGHKTGYGIRMYEFTSRKEVEEHILNGVGPSGVLESFSIPARTINHFFQFPEGGVGIYEWTDAHKIETRYIRSLDSYLFTNIERQDKRLNATRSSVSRPPQNEDTVRVLRIIEYVGPRSWVESTVARAVHGERCFTNPQCVIRGATLGAYPEILTRSEDTNPKPSQHTVCGQCGHAASIWTGHGWLCVCGQTRIDAQRLESGPTSAEERTK